jgi:hypothetical protein
MKIKHLFQFIAACGFVMTLAVTAFPCVCKDTNLIQWNAQLDPVNRDNVEIRLDARSLRTNEYLNNVSFEVAFQDARGKGLGKFTFAFPSNKAQQVANEFYVIYLKHSYAAAQVAEGVGMKLLCNVLGCMPGPRPKTIVPARKGVWEGAPNAEESTVINATDKTEPGKAKPASDFAGFWRNSDRASNYIQFIEIEANGENEVRISTWLRCNPPIARGGGIKGCVKRGPERTLIQDSGEANWIYADSPAVDGGPKTLVQSHTISLEGEILKMAFKGQYWSRNFYFERARKPR